MNRVVIAAWRFLAGLRRPSRRTNTRRLLARGEHVESFTIREATAADLPALVRLHVQMWNWTYAPYFDVGPGYAVRERQWREAFASTDRGWFCFAVERPDGEIIGLAQANTSEDPEFEGELRRIYLLPEYQRLGLGRRLVTRVAERFIRESRNSMWLFGDARNPSIGAWLAMGAEKTDDNPANGNYGWRDLRRSFMKHQLAPEDTQFRKDFESGKLEPKDFNHRAHVRLAYVYLAEHDVAGAAARMRDSLLAFLRHHNVDASKYHETMTKAWILAVRHFMETSPPTSSADAFVDANSVLLDGKIMLTHYSAELLFSPDARARFVEPDLDAIPSHER